MSRVERVLQYAKEHATSREEYVAMLAGRALRELIQIDEQEKKGERA